MSFISVFNDVLGPVMHGPSSSHTAGSYRIGRIARALHGGQPRRVTIQFDPTGSYAQVYRQQGVDLAFAAGIQEWPITDDRFERALDAAADSGIRLEFRIEALPKAGHPNAVRLRLEGGSGESLEVAASSIGGGAVRIERVDGRNLHLDGKSYEILIDVPADRSEELRRTAEKQKWSAGDVPPPDDSGRGMLVFRSEKAPDPDLVRRLRQDPDVGLRLSPPVFFVKRGDPLFDDYAGMLAAAASRERSLGEAMLASEAALLGLKRGVVAKETLARYLIMRQAVDRGLRSEGLRMQLLPPSAERIFAAEAAGRTAIGGIHTRAAARAMAVMHVSNSQGTVCAAPTGGAAGALPGVMVSLAEEKALSDDSLIRSLMAAGAVGWLIAKRSTFAAETAGCQVEIGAAGAMAAAAVVEAFGGTARQACDAAAISLQNTMGSVCDLVQGMCEIPCHTRNAVAASSAFVCADLVMGEYENPVPLDETIDAMDSVGRMLPAELRCTARGGLAVTPSALKLPRRR